MLHKTGAGWELCRTGLPAMWLHYTSLSWLYDRLHDGYMQADSWENVAQASEGSCSAQRVLNPGTDLTAEKVETVETRPRWTQRSDDFTSQAAHLRPLHSLARTLTRFEEGWWAARPNFSPTLCLKSAGRLGRLAIQWGLVPHPCLDQ